MEKTTRRFSGGVLALAAALQAAPQAFADPRLHARFYDIGDPSSRCEFSEDGQKARCVGVEGTAVSVGYACPEDWSLFRGNKNLEKATRAADDTVRARNLDIQRAVVALVPPTETMRHFACVSPSAVEIVKAGRTVSGDAPHIAPLSLTIVPGRPNLRDPDRMVVEVDRPVIDKVTYPVTVSVGAGTAKVVGQGAKLAPVGLVEIDVHARRREALNEQPSTFRPGVGTTVIVGNDVLEVSQRVGAQGNDIGEPTDVRHGMGDVAVGPTLQACVAGSGIVCGNASLQVGGNFLKNNLLALGKASLDLGGTVSAGPSGFRASVGKMREGVRAFLRLMGFVAKDGDEEVVGGGIEVGGTF